MTRSYAVAEVVSCSFSASSVAPFLLIYKIDCRCVFVLVYGVSGVYSNYFSTVTLLARTVYVLYTVLINSYYLLCYLL